MKSAWHVYASICNVDGHQNIVGAAFETFQGQVPFLL